MSHDPILVSLLHQLFLAKKNPISGTVAASTLATEAGVLISQLAAKVHELRGLGYSIVLIPSQGYQLEELEDILISDEIPARLSSHPWGRLVTIFQETASTSDLALTQGRGGAEEGTCFIAQTQTAGRGRHGRSWDSQRLGLWFSFVLRPDWLLEKPHRLTMLVSVALVQAVEKLIHAPCQIKWPNDILVEGRKLAGILIEVQKDTQGRLFASVGIGTNMNHALEDFPLELRDRATSLKIVSRQMFRRMDFFIELWEQLHTCYHQHFDLIAATWKERCASIGKPITLQDGARTLSGTMLDLTPDGAILVRTAEGIVKAVHSGEMVVQS